MKSVIYNSIDADLHAAWEALWQKSANANYTNSVYWFSTVVQHFDYKKYVVIGIYDKEELVAVAALVRLKKFGHKVYTVAPNDFVCGLPFLFDPTKPAIVKELHKQLLLLGTVYLDNVSQSFVDNFQKISHAMDVYPFSRNYRLALIPNEEGIVPFQFRRKIFRNSKEKKHVCSVKVFKGDDKEGLQQAFAIDNVSSKKVYGYNCFGNTFMKQFYRKLARQFGQAFRVYILYFEQTPVAYDIGFVATGVYYDNQSAYKIRYQHYNPGNLVVTLLMDQLAQEGVHTLDFGSGVTHQKKLITQEYEVLYKVILSRNPISRFHLRHVGKAKTVLYEKIEKNRKVYTMYRKLKKASIS